MTDPTPRPADPLDVEAIEARLRRLRARYRWPSGQEAFDQRSLDTCALLAEVRRLRADRDRLRGEVAWALAQHSSPTLAPADCRVCQRLRAALEDR